MLRKITPKERLDEVDAHFRPILLLGYAGLMLGETILQWQERLDPSIWAFAFMFATAAIAGFTAQVLWLPLTAWLGKLSMRTAVDGISAPNRNFPSLMKLLEGWWQHQTVMEVFLIVFQIAFGLALFRLFGPMLGLL